MEFHYIARAVIISDSQVLFAREVGRKYTFLPGGHIESGEAAKKALKREIIEELGLNSSVGNFLGALENCWQDKSGLNTEINLIFQTSLLPEDEKLHIQSKEPHLEFLWVPISEIESFNLLPKPLNSLIKKDNINNSAFWGSSL